MVRKAPLSGRLAARLPAFQHRNYRLFFGGQLVSLIGTWAQAIGQGWLVLELTNSPLALGAVSALQFTPSLLFGLWAGVLADRFPKRRILLCTQSVAMLLAVVLGLLTSLHLVALWHVLVLAALLGLVNALDMPTRQAFVGEMVGKEHLASAIALNASLFNAARVVGPAIAGLLIGWLGVTPLFWLNAASFVAVLVALSKMDIAPLLRRSLPRRHERRSAGGAALRAAHPGGPADHGIDRGGRHLRHELPGADPALRPRRAASRCLRLRLPDVRARPRLAAGRADPGAGRASTAPGAGGRRRPGLLAAPAPCRRSPTPTP